MMEFFTNLMIVTGGVLSAIFWVVVIPAILIELFDRAVDRKAATSTEED